MLMMFFAIDYFFAFFISLDISDFRFYHAAFSCFLHMRLIFAAMMLYDAATIDAAFFDGAMLISLH